MTGRRPRKVGLKRMDAALDAMAALGFNRQVARKTVNKLLKAYGGDEGWTFIEDGHYNVLIEAILEHQEEEKHKEIEQHKETGQSVEDQSLLPENTAEDCRSLPRSSCQDSVVTTPFQELPVLSPVAVDVLESAGMSPIGTKETAISNIVHSHSSQRIAKILEKNQATFNNHEAIDAMHRKEKGKSKKEGGGQEVNRPEDSEKPQGVRVKVEVSGDTEMHEQSMKMKKTKIFATDGGGKNLKDGIQDQSLLGGNTVQAFRSLPTAEHLCHASDPTCSHQRTPIPAPAGEFLDQVIKLPKESNLTRPAKVKEEVSEVALCEKSQKIKELTALYEKSQRVKDINLYAAENGGGADPEDETRAALSTNGKLPLPLHQTSVSADPNLTLPLPLHQQSPSVVGVQRHRPPCYGWLDDSPGEVDDSDIVLLPRVSMRLKQVGRNTGTKKAGARWDVCV